jgi:hypothetical protein
MSTPWQEIPLLDYEAHRLLPAVGEAILAADFSMLIMAICDSLR